MKIRIKGWNSSGLRSPDVKLNFETASGSDQSVVFIQMPNGTGKTSSLELLLATLSGSARKWSKEKVLSYQPNEKGLDSPSENGVFGVDLLIDDSEISFELTLDFENGIANYKTIDSASGGSLSEYKPRDSARWFFQEKFIRLVIFDGEFASGLLDPKANSTRSAIDALGQLDKFDEARLFAQTYLEGQIKKSAASVISRPALEKIGKDVDDYRAREAQLIGLKNQTEERFAELEVEINDLELARKNDVESDEERKKELEIAYNDLRKGEEARDKQLAKVDIKSKSPWTLSVDFAERLSGFCDRLEVAKVPSSTSKQFFAELAEQDLCVCGRPLGHEEKQAIIGRQDQYLGTEEQSVLNSMKDSLKGLKDGPESELSVFSDEILLLEGHARDLQLAQQKHERILESTTGDGDGLGDFASLLHNKKNELKEAKDALVLLNSEPDGNGVTSYSINEISKQLRKLTEKQSQATGTVELKEKVENIIGILNSSQKIADISVRQELLLRCNKVLESTLKQSPVTIQSIDDFVKLSGQAGGSVGQELAIGYVIMSALLERGSHDLPWVVDSPANPIDPEVRREIAKLLPQVCNQFISFVIATERESFTDVIGENSENAEYFTIYKNVSATSSLSFDIPQGADAGSTERFTMVKDKEFFENFQTENE